MANERFPVDVWGRVVRALPGDSPSDLLVERTDTIEWERGRQFPDLRKPPYRITFRSSTGDEHVWTDAEGVEDFVGVPGRATGRLEVEWHAV